MEPSCHEPPVVVKGLRKSFGSQNVLDGIDLTVASGETVAVLGRSGTGKSVLLKLLIGLQRADGGSIRILGQEIQDLETTQLDAVRKRVGFLFQQAALYDSLTLEENVSFPLSRHTELSGAERRDRARELLANVGLRRDLGKLPSQISGGMQKRVGLARALALEPDIVLFDEPTAGLDPITAAEIEKLILQLKEKLAMTAIVVTHDVRGAKSYSDRMIMVRGGRVLIQGAFSELQKSQDEFVVQFLREANR
ncbi:MAG TPA: ATP-binding cassette domain-containing protein [Bryobacteraceae bacterium]|nr:ATP-binding cassette domain-containing protein [Bryobacteraceae bacterium]